MPPEFAGYQLSVTLIDQGSNRSTLRYALTAATAEAAETDAATILTLLGAVTDAEVLSYHVGGVWEDPDVTYGAGEIENVAIASCRIDAEEVKYASVRIPAPVDGIFVAASGPLYNELDPSDNPLRSYLAIFATGNEATLSDGETIVDPTQAGSFKGHRTHRKSRRG